MAEGTPQTLFDRIWDRHVIRDLGAGWSLLHIDRHLIHDLSGAMAMDELARRDLKVADPELCFATPDHAVSSRPGRTIDTFPAGARLFARMKAGVDAAGIQLFNLGQRGQGIVHVMSPELGLTLPGMTLICADSHTGTNGGLGALAFGVGTSECVHALATQTLRLQRPKRMRITLEGAPGRGITPKDIVLHLIMRLGTDAAVGHAIEFAGPAIQAMPVEGRLTICNLSIEMGGRSGIIAPDDVTFEYLRGKPYAPQGADFDAAVDYWRTLASDPEAIFDRDVTVDMSEVEPTVTWGTNPGQAIGINSLIPDPAREADPEARKSMADALSYMGLEPGKSLVGTPVDWVFIGSCANSRLSDLRDAAKIVRGRRAAPGVNAWVVPGSVNVKLAAEAEGLDQVFTSAGFQWREPGCSMCVAANGEQVPPGARAISTSNRNFVGRQGPGARTHLASPAMAAAAAVTGTITDVRRI
jgi:3-isopropylmalate/(R)-2-methylmalate dehydratase large subunit